MYKRALVPLDGSPIAEAIIPFILEIAGPLDMAVRLLRVVEPITSVVVAGPMIVDDPVARERDAEEYLAPIAAEFRGRGVDAAWEVRRGAAPATILAAAKSLGADLIAMSTHGRSGRLRLVGPACLTRCAIAPTPRVDPCADISPTGGIAARIPNPRRGIPYADVLR